MRRGDGRAAARTPGVVVVRSSVVPAPRDQVWAGRAWILLAGIVPVEFDDLVITGMEAPRYFQERSSLGSCRVWEHRRELDALPDGSTRVTDTLRAEPRTVLPGPVVRMVVGALFRHRHRRLIRKFSAQM